MVWGIEQRIPLPSGASRAGSEAAREYHRHLQQLIGPSGPSAVEPKAPIKYQVMNQVPEQWIPFIPVHVDGSVRETQLQRAALPRILEGDPNPPEKIRPCTMLLRHNLPKSYYLHEEEVPRAGAMISQSYQRTRWVGGRVFTWLGVRKHRAGAKGPAAWRLTGWSTSNSLHESEYILLVIRPWRFRNPTRLRRGKIQLMAVVSLVCPSSIQVCSVCSTDRRVPLSLRRDQPLSQRIPRFRIPFPPPLNTCG